MDGEAGPLRVAHVVISMDVGGLERVVLDLIRRGPVLGQRVSVVCLERPGELAPEVEAAGAEVVCVAKTPGRRRESHVQLCRAFRRLAVDVVHSHQIAALYHAGPAARLAGVGAVLHTEHGNHPSRCQNPSELVRGHLLRAIAARHASRFFCVSGEIARAAGMLGAVPRRKIQVVPNGIDSAALLDPLAASPAKARANLGLWGPGPVVGTLGRLAEVKRQDVLIKGFCRVLARHPEARLVLIGDGEERATLESLALSLGLGDRVVFAGYRPDPERLLPALDVFALTSRSEGMPISILEAWAAGRPVVASRVGGIPDLIEHDRTGLLFEPGDESTMAAHLSDLLSDPVRANRLGQAGRCRVSALYDSGRMAATYDHHYREVLALRGYNREDRRRCESSR